MFVLPLVNVQKIKNFFSRIFYTQMVTQGSIPDDACPICKTVPPQTPYITNCDHVYCYYCLKQNCMLDNRYACARCNTTVTSMQRVQYDHFINEKQT